MHLVVLRSHSLICGKKHRGCREGPSRYWWAPGMKARGGEVVSTDLLKWGNLSCHTPSPRAHQRHQDQYPIPLDQTRLRVGGKAAALHIWHLTWPPCASPLPRSDMSLSCRAPPLAQSSSYGWRVSGTRTVPAMSDAIRHCSSWRICTEVTAESWNRRVAFQPLPWFWQRRSMAKISPERQPLNSKGACGEDYLVPPSKAVKAESPRRRPLPPFSRSEGWVEAGWLGFAPQWRRKGFLSKVKNWTPRVPPVSSPLAAMGP